MFKNQEQFIQDLKNTFLNCISLNHTIYFNTLLTGGIFAETNAYGVNTSPVNNVLRNMENIL